MKRFATISFLLSFLFACSTTKQVVIKQAAATALKQQVISTWNGEIPCADCPGIAYQLRLNQNDSFEERLIYLDRDVNAFNRKGTWEMGSDSIITLKDEERSQYLLFKGSYLEMLDGEGKQIQTQYRELYQLSRSVAEDNPGVLNEMEIKGIDFAASGNEPFWSLEIDFEKTMHFKNLNGLELIAPAVKGIKAADANVTRYHAETDRGTITVTLTRQKCINSMSGKESDWKVQIAVKTSNDKDYQNSSGCGRYIGNYRLNDIWALQRIGSNTIEAKDYPKGLPTLELQLAEGRAFGYGGCNRFSGSFTMEQGKIAFSAMASTKMACFGTNVEDRYLNLLSGKKLSYQVHDEVLYLGEGDTMMVFKKVD